MLLYMVWAHKSHDLLFAVVKPFAIRKSTITGLRAGYDLLDIHGVPALVLNA